MENGSQQGELSCPKGGAAPCLSILLQLLYYLAGERFFSSSSNRTANETVTTQPMKSQYTSDSQFSPMDFLFITASPQFPPSSIKEQYFPLCSRLAYGFAIL